MSVGMIIVIVILVIAVNAVITGLLIARNNVSRKLLKEIRTGVQNVINEMDTHIALAEDVSNELKLLIKKGSSVSHTANPVLVAHNGEESDLSTDTPLSVQHGTQEGERENISARQAVSPVVPQAISSESSSTIAKNQSQENITLIQLLLKKGDSDESIIETLQVSYQEIDMVKQILRKERKKK